VSFEDYVVEHRRVRRPSRKAAAADVADTTLEVMSHGTASSATDLLNLHLDEIRSMTSVRISQGNLIDKYDTVKILGEGAYGYVTEVVKKGSGENFATKVLSEKEESEIQIMKWLSHPHIVRLHEVVRDDDQLCLIMDLCPDGDMSSWIESRRDNEWKVYRDIDNSQLAKMSVEMLSAISYLHHHQVAHRDVKPGNFLLWKFSDGTMSLKLADFNLAAVFQEGQPMTQACGSLNYMAPEVIQESYTELCDVWSVGMVIHKLVCGRVAWPSGCSEETCKEMILKGDIRLDGHRWERQDLAGCKDLLMKLFCSESAGRLTAKAALKEKWLVAHLKNSKEHSNPSKGCCIIS